MVKEKIGQAREGLLGGPDPYWESLIRGIHDYGSDVEMHALNHVMHQLKHAELHPKERNSPHRIGHGKGRHLPRRYRETVS